jgi:hypothetical protein
MVHNSEFRVWAALTWVFTAVLWLGAAAYAGALGVMGRCESISNVNMTLLNNG